MGNLGIHASQVREIQIKEQQVITTTVKSNNLSQAEQRYLSENLKLNHTGATNELSRLLKDDIEYAFGTKKSIKDNMAKLNADNVWEVLDEYQKLTGKSLLQGIADEWGGLSLKTRVNYIKQIKSAVEDRTGIRMTNFDEFLQKEIDKFGRMDTKKLDEYITKTLDQARVYQGITGDYVIPLDDSSFIPEHFSPDIDQLKDNDLRQSVMLKPTKETDELATKIVNRSGDYQELLKQINKDNVLEVLDKMFQEDDIPIRAFKTKEQLDNLREMVESRTGIKMADYDRYVDEYCEGGFYNYSLDVYFKQVLDLAKNYGGIKGDAYYFRIQSYVDFRDITPNFASEDKSWFIYCDDVIMPVSVSGIPYMIN